MLSVKDSSGAVGVKKGAARPVVRGVLSLSPALVPYRGGKQLFYSLFYVALLRGTTDSLTA